MAGRFFLPQWAMEQGPSLAPPPAVVALLLLLAAALAIVFLVAAQVVQTP